MSLAATSWTVAGTLAAVLAAGLLWRAPGPRDPADQQAYRRLAVAAVAWGAAFVAQATFTGPLGGTAIPLTLADLLALAALPALVVGVMPLAGAPGQRPGGHGRQGRLARGLGSGRAPVARVADGFGLAAALFIVGWVAVFGPAYASAEVGAGAFALDLIHPVADLITLAVVVVIAVRAGRRGLAPVLALLAALAGDALEVSARTSGTHPGAWPQTAWITGLCLLGSAPLRLPGRLGTGRARRGLPDAGGHGAAASAAVLAACAGAVGLAGWAVGAGRPGRPVLVAAGLVAAAALVIRTTGLLRRSSAAVRIWRESDRQFRELADRTSDVVLVCDLDGNICYASPAVSDYGYAAETLLGSTLSGLVHPEDAASARRAALAALRGTADQPGRLGCRVRAADSTWRHVESTISRSVRPAGPARLLVTARDVSDQVALRRQVTHLTFHDGLTGLPNRAYLEERAKGLLGAMQRAGEAPAAEAGAIFVDLDGFTAVNDSVGHGAGDLLLAQAGRRLRDVAGPHDTVARWGGDEFAVLIESAASAREIVDVAERLAGSIAAEPFRVAGRDISLTASIGVALAGKSVSEHLLRNADVAMSRAKASGGGRVEVFASHMHADIVRRLEMATDLREAIAARRLDLVYQPIVDIAAAEVVGVEALVRWRRGGQPVPPAEFLGVAEDSGLIVPLGDWTLREACHQAAAWRSAGWPVGLSVNCSPRQVSASRFRHAVLAALDASGLPPQSLTLEVTERVLIEGAQSVIACLAELRATGIRLAIDDFGTGYASLAYLRQLHADVIKIDPSFVAGLGVDSTLAMLTRTIVRVGHDLGIEVVAEGIERPEQLALLREMGCGLGQGFLLAMPMTAGDVQTAAGPALTVPRPAVPAPGGGVSQAPAVL